MVAVSGARGGSVSLVLGNIVHHASPELMSVMCAKHDPTHVDYLRHADKMELFSQSIGSWTQSKKKQVLALITARSKTCKLTTT